MAARATSQTPSLSLDLQLCASLSRLLQTLSPKSLTPSLRPSSAVIRNCDAVSMRQSSVNARITPKGYLATREHAHSGINLASLPIAMTSSSMIRGDCINACAFSDTENALYTHTSCTSCAASALD
ncbi:hypothetical protein Tco_1099167 [Tanacetum coccineum]